MRQHTLKLKGVARTGLSSWTIRRLFSLLKSFATRLVHAVRAELISLLPLMQTW